MLKKNIITNLQPALLMSLFLIFGCASHQAMKNASGFYEEGKNYYGQGDLKNAMKSIKNAIKLNGGFAEAHVVLGLVYDKLHDHKKAEREFDRAFALQPMAEDFRKEMADFYKKIGMESIGNKNLEKAIKCLVKSMYLNKDDEETKSTLALCYYKAATIFLKSEKYGLAEKYFQNAQMLCPLLHSPGKKAADLNGQTK